MRLLFSKQENENPNYEKNCEKVIEMELISENRIVVIDDHLVLFPLGKIEWKRDAAVIGRARGAKEEDDKLKRVVEELGENRKAFRVVKAGQELKKYPFTKH